tara:strand:+ start:1616 stop:2860 length:1245 start_codon:yes stop_codon:yes gene_type:complete
MSKLKPIGSEKLTGQDKISRMMEIARFKEVAPKTINENATSEYSISLADGNKYEIVRERQGYIIKKTISESETDYIEPMKNRKYYSSYSQAFKRLNLVAGELNRLNENDEGVSLYGEQKKFTLKTPKAPAPEMPAAELPMAPPAVPSPELPPSPMGGEEMPMDDMGGEEMPMDDMGGEEVDVDVDTEMGGNEDKVTFKTIQKLTGKLTQKIRVLDSEEGMTSEDIKYVINMVLSSLDLTSLTEEDLEDIMDKFEEDETEDYGQEDDMGGEDFTDDTEVEDIQADMDVPVEGYELGEEYDEEYEEEDYGNGAIFDSIFAESQVDKVISKYFEVSKQEIREQKEKQVQKTLQKKSVVKNIMESVTKMTETIEQELAAEKFVNENINSKFVGITNKKNLVFENKGKQFKITPNGLLL